MVRRASPADAAHLAILCREHAEYEGISPATGDHAACLQWALAQEQIHVWLVCSGDKPIGYASATLDYATLAGQHYVHMDCLFLQPEQRGKGLGALLMQQIRQFGQAHACINMQWQTPHWNRDAIRFYQRSGAQQMSKERFVLDL